MVPLDALVLRLRCETLAVLNDPTVPGRMREQTLDPLPGGRQDSPPGQNGRRRCGALIRGLKMTLD
ncbi:hypothetical protein GCM10011504_35560 [Siccirubricoccus deserti]|nr:hypothetical protein GCM10011504_35560 [Siccirubricoccus deserti]